MVNIKDVICQTKLVNKIDDLIEKEYDPLGYIMDQKLIEKQTSEMEEFMNRSETVLKRYYEDVATMDRLQGIGEREYVLSIRSSPKKLKKHFQ